MSKSKSLLDGLEISPSVEQFRSYDDDGNELWEIENIIKERIQNNKKEYLVKWKGWEYKYSTWETAESFIENVDYIRECLQQYNQSVQKVNSSIQKTKKKNKGKRSKRKANNKRSKKAEKVSETKIVIHRIPFNEPIQENAIEATKLDFYDYNLTDINPIGMLGSDKEIEMIHNFDEFNDDTTTQIHTDENEGQGNHTNNSTLYWGLKQTSIGFGNDSDCGSGGHSPSRLEEIEAEKMTQMLSCPSQIKYLKSSPIMENELEQINEYKIIIEECFAYPQTNSGQFGGAFRFKVAFYDNQENLKGYDYFTYDEIKSKNWDMNLLDFFTEEILTEFARNGRSLTKNIKVL